jgi:Ni,Fe-hydrogenase I cytochrome b subunit
MKKSPFRLTPYQVQFLLVVGFVTVGYALYLRYLAVEFSTVALACDAGLQSLLCKSRTLATTLFKNSVFGIVALIIATLHVMRPSIVLLTGGLIAAGLGIVLYNIVLSGLAIWKPVQLQYLTALFGGYDAARYVHFFCMAAIVAFMVVHVALALLVPKSLRAMIIGR